MRVECDDGVELEVSVEGSGDATVLLVHGWMVSSAVWSGVGGRLRGHQRLVWFDHRGTGRSGTTDAISIERYARDVLQVLDAIDASSAVVIGHSMGGQIAQLVAARHPDRVKALALLCPVPASGLPLPDDAVEGFGGAGEDPARLGGILDMACKQLAPQDRTMLVEDAVKIRKETIRQSFDAWRTASFSDALANITAPTLCLATDDPFLPPDLLAETVVKPIRGARLAYLPGSGHYPQLERPAETAAILDAFLAGTA